MANHHPFLRANDQVNAGRYAQAMGEPEEAATSLFSSAFAALYLGLEVSLKVTGSLVSKFGDTGSKYTIYALYSLIAVAATFGIALVDEMEPEIPAAAGARPGCAKVTAALTLLGSSAKCALMVPTNFAFGFASAFMTAYLQGSVVAPVGDSDDAARADAHASQVLLYSSVAVGVATLLALPGFGFHYVRAKAGTAPVMLVGAASFCLVALLSLALSPRDLRHALWLVYIVYGAGRSVWESTVKVRASSGGARGIVRFSG